MREMKTVAAFSFSWPASPKRSPPRSDPHGRMELLLWLIDDSLEFQLLDYAAPVDKTCIKPRDLAVCRPGGLGINLIDSVMDAWHFEDPPAPIGNLLTMRKRLPL